MYTTTALDSINISEIGNCSINMINDSYEEYYIIVESNLGITTVTKFGPIKVDMNLIDDKF